MASTGGLLPFGAAGHVCRGELRSRSTLLVVEGYSPRDGSEDVPHVAATRLYSQGAGAKPKLGLPLPVIGKADPSPLYKLRRGHRSREAAGGPARVPAPAKRTMLTPRTSRSYWARGGSVGSNGGCGPSTVCNASHAHASSRRPPPTPIAPSSWSSTMIGSPPLFG